MKFTNGYWLMRDGMKPIFATDTRDVTADGGVMTAYVAGKKIVTRGDTLDFGMITVSLSSPMENVVRVSAVHHDGANEKGAAFEINDLKPETKTHIGSDTAVFTSGELSASISRASGDYSLSFSAGGKQLTKSGWHALAHITDTENKKRYMVESLDMDIGEYVYGLGERFTPFVKNGQTVDTWNEDGGTASEISYKNIPFYITNRGYGVFVSHPDPVSFEIASEKVERVQFSVEGERLEYYVIYGKTPMEIIERYTALTGRPALPPAWSFGLWLSTSFTTDYNEQTATSFIQGMADRNIPLRVFHFDCFWMREFTWCDFKWDSAVTTDPEGMIKRYKERGLKICLWINPYIAQKSYMFEEGKKNGYFIKNKDGSVWQWDRWQAGQAIVDFTNPSACKWYQKKLEALLDMGVDCFKTDFGERIPYEDVTFFSGAEPMAMHNYYTELYNKTVFEVLEKRYGKGGAVLFARSATAGGQQYPVHWGGDCNSTYPSMAETLRGGLSLSLCGFGFWSHDIGGFENTSPADIYKRWCAFGLLCSHSRLHGSMSYRVPWAYDEEASEVLKHFVNLKCRLMPYIFAKAVESHEKGRPVLRPMMLAYPEDNTTLMLDRQYMLGDKLLVAPVLSKDGETEYYLPYGVSFTHLLSGEKREGGRWYKEKYDYFSLPLFVPSDTVLPVGSNDSLPDYDYGDNVTLELFDIADGASHTVEIPDVNGKLSRKAVVTRNGNTITAEMSGKGAWSVLVRGVYGLIGGADEKLGCRFAANGSSVTINL